MAVTESDFEARVMAMADDLYRVCACLLAVHQDREDAVQEGIWKAWRELPRLRDEQRFRPWLMRIVIHECRNIGRKKRKEAPLEVIDERENTDVQLVNTELRQALSQLPEKQRLALTLYYMDGFSVSDVAEILRISSGTVKSRLSRGRDELRRMMGKEV